MKNRIENSYDKNIFKIILFNYSFASYNSIKINYLNFNKIYTIINTIANKE